MRDAIRRQRSASGILLAVQSLTSMWGSTYMRRAICDPVTEAPTSLQFERPWLEREAVEHIRGDHLLILIEREGAEYSSVLCFQRFLGGEFDPG